MMIEINPGSSDVDVDCSEEQAVINMTEFVKEVGDADFCRSNPRNDSGGRYCFQVRTFDGARSVFVEMPGCELVEVRDFFRRSPSGKPGPRLYVDGSSWWWKWAVSVARSYLDCTDA